MFTKKLEDQFSADLLNTVRGVLDESKKCKDCGCSKCECEDEEDEKDEMKEANLTGLPKSTAEKNKQYIEITHLLGHKRRVPVHPTNAYKALNRYRNDPSTKSARIVSEEAELEESKILDAHFEKQTPKVQGHLNALLRRGHTYPEAVKKVKGATPLGEEAEQIDELSKKTLGSYVKRASTQAFGKGYTGGSMIVRGDMNRDKEEENAGEKNVNKGVRRLAGISKATDKLTKEEQEFIDALNDADIDQIDELSVKTLDNYRTKARKEIIDADANDDNRLYNKRAKGYRAASKSVSKKFAKEEAEQIDELSKGTMLKYLSANKKDDAKARETGDFDKMTKRMRGTDVAVRKYTARDSKYVRVPATEEVEELDELSTKTVDSYREKAYAQQPAGDDGSNLYRKRKAGRDMAFKKVTHGAKVPATEEIELTQDEIDRLDTMMADLDEARGRPPKEGTPAWHARQKQANDDMVALGVQLRKAKSMNKKVRFMNGKEHEIHPSHIDKFEDHMAARKTSQDKAAFQKQAHKSHEDFVKAVTAPVPKSSKDTGEIVKYRH